MLTNLLMLSIALAIVAALIDYLFGIKDPWRKIIYAGVVVLFVLGILQLFGLLPRFG